MSNEDQVERIYQVLRDTLDGEGPGQWMRSGNRLLGGRRPADVIDEDPDAVENAARAYAEGTYL